jgi:hypothetical protein
MSYYNNSLGTHYQKAGKAAMRIPIIFGFVLAVLSFSCRRATKRPETLSALKIATIADTIKAVALASEASWSLVACNNLTPALQYWDGSPPGLVHSHEDAFKVYTDATWADQVKRWVCAARGKTGSGKSIVDTILVSALSHEIATASMLYHAVGYDSTGVERSHHGQILRVFHRTNDGWKIRVSMSTHIPDKIQNSK